MLGLHQEGGPRLSRTKLDLEMVKKQLLPLISLKLSQSLESSGYRAIYRTRKFKK